MIDLESITTQASHLVQEVGKYIQQEAVNFSKEDVEHKGKNDFVSYVDKTAEKKLVAGLKEIFPEAGFITEEDTANLGGDYQWVIDPLDGTTNFIHSIPFYCISVGLIHQNIPITGVILSIEQEDLFLAWKGGGAYLNGKKINVNDSIHQIENALVATGFPYNKMNNLTIYMQVLTNIIRRSRGVRRLGSAALDLAYVACGRFDAFYEFGLNPWDVAAGIVLVQEAGGKVSDFSGSDEYLFGGEILASVSHIHKELIELIRQV